VGLVQVGFSAAYSAESRECCFSTLLNLYSKIKDGQIADVLRDYFLSTLELYHYLKLIYVDGEKEVKYLEPPTEMSYVDIKTLMKEFSLKLLDKFENWFFFF
jgi:hypothetical protein